MIYMTPFDPATKQCTGPSVPAGIGTMSEVVLLFGGNYQTHSARCTVYETLAFTDYVLRSEP